jgi:hypothetical protein
MDRRCPHAFWCPQPDPYKPVRVHFGVRGPTHTNRFRHLKGSARWRCPLVFDLNLADRSLWAACSMCVFVMFRPSVLYEIEWDCALINLKLGSPRDYRLKLQTYNNYGHAALYICCQLCPVVACILQSYIHLVWLLVPQISTCLNCTVLLYMKQRNDGI